jgi:hypothetical protein
MQHKTVDKSLNDNLISLGPSNDVCCSKSSAEVESGSPGVDNGVIDDNLSQIGGDVDIQTNRPNELEDMVSFLFSSLCFAIFFFMKLLIRISPSEVLQFRWKIFSRKLWILPSLMTQPWSF